MLIKKTSESTDPDKLRPWSPVEGDGGVQSGARLSTSIWACPKYLGLSGGPYFPDSSEPFGGRPFSDSRIKWAAWAKFVTGPPFL
jgi:hypothetical protein